LALPVVDILMYHSISDDGGATSISPAAFRMQMAAIAAAGVPVITLNDYLAGAAGKRALAPRSVILTFDDGFQDFADQAWPVMQNLGFRPIVYVPTAHVGRREDWALCHPKPRRIMDWPLIRALAADGVEFGSHTVSHQRLTELAPEVMEVELATARTRLETMLERSIPHFAAPYGAANGRERAGIARIYRTSVSTVLASAGPGSDPHCLPRLDMFYFTDPGHWRRQLAGMGGPYLLARQTLRKVRRALAR